MVGSKWAKCIVLIVQKLSGTAFNGGYLLISEWTAGYWPWDLNTYGRISTSIAHFTDIQYTPWNIHAFFLRFVLLWLSNHFLMDSCDLSTHIPQGCYTGTGAIVWLPSVGEPLRLQLMTNHKIQQRAIRVHISWPCVSNQLHSNWKRADRIGIPPNRWQSNTHKELWTALLQIMCILLQCCVILVKTIPI